MDSKVIPPAKPYFPQEDIQSILKDARACVAHTIDFLFKILRCQVVDFTHACEVANSVSMSTEKKTRPTGMVIIAVNLENEWM